MSSTLPEGFTLDKPQTTSLPGGFVLDSVKPGKKQNFFERFGGDLKERFGEQGTEIITAFLEDEQNLPETIMQWNGKVIAGTAMDFIGEVLISGGRGLSAVTPDVIEDPIKGGATFLAHKMLETDAGQAGLEKAKEGLASYQEWAGDNPAMARNLDAVVNIGLLATPVKIKPRAPGASALGRAGQRVERSGRKSQVKNRRDFIDKLVRPEQTKRVRTDQVSRTSEQGLFKKKVAELTRPQADSAREIARIPGVSAQKTIQGNYNVLQKAVSAEAAGLERALANFKGNRVFDFDEYFKVLDEVKAGLGNSALVGDSAKIAERVIDQMKIIVPKNGVTLDKLLRSRKDLDAWIVKQKPKAFDPNTANAMSMAVREVRQATNNFIAQRAPSVRIRSSLDKQFRLLRAMDDIAVKAASEGDSAIRRSFQKVLSFLPLRSEFNNAAALVFGVGGLGAAAMFAPFFTKLAGTVGATYVAGKAIMAPSTRKGLGQLIKFIDQAMLKASDPAVLAEMRVDRALIVELIKTSESDE